MSGLRYLIVIGIYLTTVRFSFCQNYYDSLKRIWTTDSYSDSIRLSAFQKFIWNGYLRANPDSAIYYAKLEYELALEMNDSSYMAKALNIQGVASRVLGQYADAINFHLKSLTIREAMGDFNAASSSYNNLGVIYYDFGEYDKSIDYYTKSLKTAQKVGNKKRVATVFNNVGLIYYKQQNYKQAMSNFEQSLQICESIEYWNVLRKALINMGLVYEKLDKPEEAIACYIKSKDLAQDKTNDLQGVSIALNNIAGIHLSRQNYDSALIYYKKSLSIKEQLGNDKGIATSLTGIAHVYSARKNYKRAILNANRALSIAQRLEIASELSNVSFMLYDCYKKIGNYEQSLKMHELYSATKNKMLNETNKEYLLRMELKRNYEKQAIADSIAFIKQQEIKDLKIAEQEAKIESDKIEKIAVYASLIMILTLGLLIYKNYSIKAKANKLFVSQNIELKNKNEAIYRLNNNLEELVARRTEKLKESLEQIREYHFDLVHHIRSPLAALLGFIQHFENEKFESKQVSRRFQLLKEISVKIDGVIRNISLKMSSLEKSADDLPKKNDLDSKNRHAEDKA